jgi:hypothetical protein
MKIKNWQEATLKELIEQLEFCEYECEAGTLTMNVAFLELKRRSNEEINQKEALEFYANYDNYSKNTALNGYDVLSDNGELARNALKE